MSSFASAPYPSNIGINPSGTISSRTNSTAHPMVASASVLPGPRTKPVNTGQPLHQFLDETREFYRNVEKEHEQERQLWTKERELWQHQRKAYLERIDQLEATITSLTTNGCSSASPGGTVWHIDSNLLASYQVPDSKVKSPPTSHQSIPTQRNIWEGPESQPTRAFSEPTIAPTLKPFDRLHSIAEQPENDRKKSVGFVEPTGQSRSTSLPGVPGELFHPNLDGITLKSSGLPGPFKRAVEEAIAEDSPNRTPSPMSMVAGGGNTSVPLVVPRPKLLDIPSANMNSEQLYNAYAGHTPLARVIGSEGTTGSMTPVKPIEVDRPPLEPHPTQAVVRIPNERADSYFVNAGIPNLDGTTETDEDPALKGPLGVADDKAGSSLNFLDKVNDALEKVVSSEQLGELSPPAPKGHNRGLSEADDHKPLRMKSSTNFGAPFGQSS